MNKNEAKRNIQRLIDKYQAVVKSGRISKYSEEETKKDFILPLFEILGWDVHDKNEVSAEESQTSGGRVDYGFYLNTTPKFFLEAKAFKQDIHKEEFAKQAVRYSWNKGVTWAVLTNFETIIVFNAQDIESRYLGDKRLFEIPCNEYIKRFDQLWQLSRESLETNSIDKYAEQIGKKLQKVSISATLYKDLSICREMLTKSISISNPNVDKDLIDEGVQRLLDRLIFIRVAEDREIEPPTLIPLLREWETKHRGKIPVYQSMIKKFRELDKIYNSNLFLPHPFENWDDNGGAVEKVIPLLYGKEGYYEYDFKIMPADVLGSVYENYLGYRLSKSKKGATINKDAKKRKEQGIYYTPTFIVDYIVKNALKPILDQCKSISDLKKIKVLDPACGSGSFLIKALEVISEKYKEFHYDDAYTKFQILTQNIYGVDLDEQAVEIAQLNLLINALDKRVKLPILTNIKNGNSLISGTDEELKKYFGSNFRDKKPFNWEEEFPEVFAQGGFDVIIGNPPWVFTRGEHFSDLEKKYFDNLLVKEKIVQPAKGKNIQSGKLNLYSLFIIKSITLMKNQALFGFIIPNNILRTTTYDIVRKYMLDNCKVTSIVDVSIGIFKGVTASSIILIFEKESNKTRRDSNEVLIISEIKDLVGGRFKKHKMTQVAYYDNASFTFNILSDSGSAILSKKIEKNSQKLGSLCKYIIEGIVGSKERDVSNEKLSNLYRPFLTGKDIGRYKINYKDKWICYDRKLLHRARPEEVFLSDKILVQRIGGGNSPLIATLDKSKYYTFASINNIILKYDVHYGTKYILTLINSKLMNWYYSTNFSNRSALTVNVSKTFLEQLPIKIINSADQKLFMSYADKMLDLNKKLNTTEKNSNKWLKLKSEIEKTDKKIDEEVYKLYNLTPEEIKIVENSTK